MVEHNDDRHNKPPSQKGHLRQPLCPILAHAHQRTHGGTLSTRTDLAGHCHAAIRRRRESWGSKRSLPLSMALLRLGRLIVTRSPAPFATRPLGSQRSAALLSTHRAATRRKMEPDFSQYDPEQVGVLLRFSSSINIYFLHARSA